MSNYKKVMMAAASGGADTGWVWRVGKTYTDETSLNLSSVATDYDGGVIAAYIDTFLQRVHLYKLDADGAISVEKSFNLSYNSGQPLNNLSIYKVNNNTINLIVNRQSEWTVAEINPSTLAFTVKTATGYNLPRQSNYRGSAHIPASNNIYHLFVDDYRNAVISSNAAASSYSVPSYAQSRGTGFSGDYGYPFIVDFGGSNGVRCLTGGTYNNGGSSGSNYFPMVTIWNDQSNSPSTAVYFDDNSQGGNPSWLSRQYRMNPLGEAGSSNTYVIPFRHYATNTFSLCNLSYSASINWTYEYYSSGFPQYPTSPIVKYNSNDDCYYIAFTDDDDLYFSRVDTSGNTVWANKITTSNPAGAVYGITDFPNKMAVAQGSSGDLGGFFVAGNTLYGTSPITATTLFKVPSTGFSAGTYTDNGAAPFANVTYTVTDLTSGFTKTSRVLQGHTISSTSNHSYNKDDVGGGLSTATTGAYSEKTTVVDPA